MGGIYRCSVRTVCTILGQGLFSHIDLTRQYNHDNILLQGLSKVRLGLGVYEHEGLYPANAR